MRGVDQHALVQAASLCTEHHKHDRVADVLAAAAEERLRRVEEEEVDAGAEGLELHEVVVVRERRLEERPEALGLGRLEGGAGGVSYGGQLWRGAMAGSCGVRVCGARSETRRIVPSCGSRARGSGRRGRGSRASGW